MKITQAHLDYWAERHAPAIFKDLLGSKNSSPPVSIHSLINSQVPLPPNWTPAQRNKVRECLNETSNTLHLLRMARRRGTNLGDRLLELVNYPGCIHANKRKAICRKWLARVAPEKLPVV